jgi:hypothetical protein
VRLGRLLLVLFLAGCSSAISPTSTASTHVSPHPSASPSPSATPLSYWSGEKLGEGGHDRPPLLMVPAATSVDYTVRGICDFEFNVDTAQHKPAGPHFAVSVTGPEITGSWRLRLTPGDYYIYPGEAVGCTYTFNVRDDS